MRGVGVPHRLPLRSMYCARHPEPLLQALGQADLAQWNQCRIRLGGKGQSLGCETIRGKHSGTEEGGVGGPDN